MTITPVGLLRGIWLVFGIAGLLLGTVLFPVAQRLLQAWLRMGERLAGSRVSAPPAVITRMLGSAVILRAWQLVCAAIGFGCWWYLGTAHGAAFLAAVLRPH